MQISKWTAEGMVKGYDAEYSMTYGRRYCREYDSILQREWATINSGWHRGFDYSSLAKLIIALSGTFLLQLIPDKKEMEMNKMLQMSYEQFEELAKAGNYDVIPVSKEIYADMTTPLMVLKILKSVSSHTYILESVEDRTKWGRYTFLGYNPTLELTCNNNIINIKAKDSTVCVKDSSPDEEIKKIISHYKSPDIDYLPNFTGGLVGYFSYDYIKYSEPALNLDAKDEENFNDADLMLFDKVIAFDNLKQKIIVIVNADITKGDLKQAYDNAVTELEDIVNLIKTKEAAPIAPGKITSKIRPLFNEEEFCNMVEKAKTYIREGDIFQVVLSNRLDADFEGSLFDTYRILRTTNPSPYMFYFSSPDIEIAGASPETLVKCEDKTLHTFPLAGTRPRGKDNKEDISLEKELLADEKERAEHNMLVDLGRNDLGKISTFGSVEVEKYMSIERFSHVMHIGSTVRGTLRDDKNPIDAIGAVLPAGTLSGAPKFRACEIINELENNKRGIYGGAIGYIDFKGNLDTCISIRLVFKKNGKVFIRSGAGIVADSVPVNEYNECINKAKAVVNALNMADGGVD